MSSFDPATAPKDVVIHYDVPCTLSDGTVLRADIARPAGEGRWPVILARTPYGKAVAPGFTTDLTHGARHGYVTIIQDVRGRGASDGKADFQPWVDEGQDGAEAVEWAAALPYSDGRVHMSGPSYLGFVQWAAAAERPPSLRAIHPIVPVGHFTRSFIYSSGVFELELNGYWWAMLGVEALMRRDWESSEAKAKAVTRAAGWLEALARDGYDHLPLNRFAPVAESIQGAQLFDLLRNGANDSSMKASVRSNDYENITVPALIVAGWYDIFIRGSIDQFVGMRSKGGSDAARQKSRLIVGPWAHHPQGKMTGEQISPGSAQIQALNPFGHMGVAARYFSALNDAENAEAPVKIWVMGADRWRDEQEWPIARTVVTPWYLSSGGRANTSGGDGALTPQPVSGGVPADAFVYDPANPVPTRGGAVFGVSCVPGGSDQNVIEKREDILVYKSGILEQDVEVTGTSFVELWVKTDVVDTDFVARLVDVHPDGTARLITDGILRARYRENPDDPTRPAAPLEPGKPYLLRIELLPTSNLFKAGHRLQVDVTSSCFPRWARNLNIWDEWGGTLADARVARQQVLHDEAHPSRILLPVIPAAG